jgi:APA family basic amino acid/polyamine antiporter
MVMKIVIISAVVFCGWFFIHNPHPLGGAVLDRTPSFDLVTAIGAAMVPVAFAYGGWQTSNFVADEIRDPTKNLPRALVLGVSGVVVLYLAINFICVRALGPDGLAATTTPASAVMRSALGERGAAWIAVGIAISALGFLSQGILTAPRVYFAMARDGVFFKSLAWLNPKSRVPVVAIVVQGVWAIVIALSGRYEQILNFFISMDFLFIGLSGTCLFVFRRREARAGAPALTRSRMPGHPWTTIFFVVGCWIVVASTLYKYPGNSLIGLAIVAAGIPVYFFWGSRRTQRGNAE